MAKSKKTDLTNAREFVTRLQTMVQSLPTETEKNQAREKIAASVEFLQAVQAAVESLPSIESANNVSSALEWLQNLLTKAESNPALAGLLPETSSPRPKRAGKPQIAPAFASQEIECLNSLSIDELRDKLWDEGVYSVAQLRAIAAELGIPGAARLSRESLARHISTKIANFRGYQKLCGNGDKE